MSATHDQAICLRHREWSETSQTVILLTRAHGLVRGLAKGSRRERANFSGGFELLQLGEVGLILKPDRDLALLTDWDLRNPYTPLRRDYTAGVLCMFAAELTASSLAPHDPHPVLFAAFEAFLTRSAANPPGVVPALGGYLAALLTETGQSPDLAPPGGNAAAVDPVLWFDPARGGLLDRAASVPVSSDPFDPRSRHDAVWPIRRRTLEALAALSGPGPGPTGEAAIRSVRFLAAWLIYRAGRRPASLDAFLRVTRTERAAPETG